jgi:O-antigen/teichoic acid export membrane protein
MQTIISKLLRNPYLLFLVDGLGALLSATLLLLVVAPLEVYFGMPSTVVKVLGIIACMLMICSVSCCLVKPRQWILWMRTVAAANLLYACSTAILLFLYAHQLTLLGFLYFVGEIIILCILVILERKAAATSTNSTY